VAAADPAQPPLEANALRACRGTEAAVRTDLAAPSRKADVHALDAIRMEPGGAAVERAGPTGNAIAFLVAIATRGANARRTDVEAVSVLAGGTSAAAFVTEPPAPRNADSALLRRIAGAVPAGCLVGERATDVTRIATVPIHATGPRADALLTVTEANPAGAVARLSALCSERRQPRPAASPFRQADVAAFHLAAREPGAVVGPALRVGSAGDGAVTLARLVVHHAQARPRTARRAGIAVARRARPTVGGRYAGPPLPIAGHSGPALHPLAERRGGVAVGFTRRGLRHALKATPDVQAGKARRTAARAWLARYPIEESAEILVPDAVRPAASTTAPLARQPVLQAEIEFASALPVTLTRTAEPALGVARLRHGDALPGPRTPVVAHAVLLQGAAYESEGAVLVFLTGRRTEALAGGASTNAYPALRALCVGRARAAEIAMDREMAEPALAVANVAEGAGGIVRAAGPRHADSVAHRGLRLADEFRGAIAVALADDAAKLPPDRPVTEALAAGTRSVARLAGAREIPIVLTEASRTEQGKEKEGERKEAAHRPRF